MQNKKFIASFSGGKDSMLAIDRAIKQGLIPIGMITTCPMESSQSWFHKVEHKTLFAIADSIKIPLTLVPTTGEAYEENFEKALLQAKDNGAEIVVFGDIDIEEHLQWCTKRCEAVGLKAYFPLWQEKRESVVREFIDRGFKAKIIVAKHEKLQDGYLGEILTHELMDKMALTGIDVCGENGEYHTIVIDGPLFQIPVTVNIFNHS